MEILFTKSSGGLRRKIFAIAKFNSLLMSLCAFAFAITIGSGSCYAQMSEIGLGSSAGSYASVCEGSGAGWDVAYTVSWGSGGVSSSTWTLPSGFSLVYLDDSPSIYGGYSTIFIESTGGGGGLLKVEDNLGGHQELWITVTTNSGSVSGTPAINGSITATQNTTGVYSTTVANATDYVWSVDGDAKITAGNGSSQVTVTFGTATPVTISVTGHNPCSATETSPGTLAVDVSAGGGTPPAAPNALEATNVDCHSFTANWEAVDGADYYELDVTEGSLDAQINYFDYFGLEQAAGGEHLIRGQNINSGGSDLFYNVTNLASGYSLKYRVRAVSNTNGSSVLFSNVIDVITLNQAPTPEPISYSTLFPCAGSPVFPQYYSTGAVGASSYTWTVPDGWVITGAPGLGTTYTTSEFAIEVTVGTEGSSGNVSVTASNECGTSSPVSIAVKAVGDVGTVGPIYGDAAVCADYDNTGAVEFQHTYSVTPEEGATYYWQYQTDVASGGYMNIVSFNGIDLSHSYSITVTFPYDNTTSGVIQVDKSNDCSGPTLNTLHVTVNDFCVGTPGDITGGVSTCEGTGVTFTKGTCPDGTCYWQTAADGGADGTSTSLSGSTYTTSTAAGNYQVWVRALSGGHWSTAVTKSGTVGAAPTAVTAYANGTTPATVCEDAYLALTFGGGTGGTSYTWSGPGSFSGNVTPFKVTASSDGLYTITATNSCGSKTSSVDVTVTVVAAPTGTTPQTMCPGTNYYYNLTATGTNIKWYRDGADITNDNQSQTEEGQHYLASQTVGGCESVARFDKTVLLTSNLSSVGVVPSTAQSFATGGSGNQLTASETGGGTITSRQWKYGTVSGIYGNNIGAGLSTYTPASAALGAGAAGTYYVVCVSTPTCGSAMTSNPVTVTVSSPPSGLTWLGTSSPYNWSNAANWDNGGNLPTGSDDVIIPSAITVPNQPLIPNGITGLCQNITINAGASLTVNGTLTATGSMLIKSDATGTGALVQGVGSKVTLPGNASVQRYIPGVSGFHLLSTPVSNLTAGQLALQGIGGSSYVGGLDYSLYKSGHLDNLWYYYEPNTITTIPVGGVNSNQNGWMSEGKSVPVVPIKGYTLNINGGGKAIFNGSLNNGQYSMVVSNTPSAKSSDDGWNLVGNPYPSYIDWDAVSGWDRTANMENAYSVMETTSGGGQFYSYSSGISNPEGKTSRYIPPMQAFWIKVYNPNSSGNFGVTNEVRTSLSAQPFYKKGDTNKLLRLSSYLNNNTDKKDYTVVYFRNDATEGFNSNFDVSKLFNPDPLYPNIYSILSGERCSIKAMPEVKEDLVIPIGFKANTPGNYTINAYEFNNFDAETNIFLVDTKNNVSQDLTVNPLYNFYIDGTDEARFFLKFKLMNVGLGDKAKADICNIFTSGNTLFVNYNNHANEKALLSIFNIAGQNIRTDVKISNGNYQANIDVAPGAYFVKVIASGKVYVQKIFVK